jgi:hypothetical protein
LSTIQGESDMGIFCDTRKSVRLEKFFNQEFHSVNCVSFVLD